MIKLDQASENLLLINYPSGGYGFYFTRLINSFVTNIVKTNDSFEFDQLGTSHLLPLVTGHIHWEQNRTLHIIDSKYQPDVNQQKYILIPYCPGIENNITENLKHNFPKAKIIRLCYKDNTWPLIFQNCIVKAGMGNLDTDIKFDDKKFGSSEDWARRENFNFIFNDHEFRNMWKEHSHERFLNIDIFEILINPTQCLQQVANFIGSDTQMMDMLPIKHKQFLKANPNTITHLKILEIINSLNIEQDLTHIQQLYSQAVLNFYIQLKFNFVIPTNDYNNWFTNTNEIVTMLQDHGVDIDTH